MSEREQGEFFTTVREAYQSRYVAYAEAHGRTPDEQAAADTRPDGSYQGWRFVEWINTRWTEWETETGGHRGYAASGPAFDAWLRDRVRRKWEAGVAALASGAPETRE